MSFDSSVIVPVHNRRDITLDCLHRLARDGVFDWAHVIVVDDGSIDGTRKAVHAAFPQVKIIEGDGDLWWTGAMVMGMQAALDRGAEYLLWLNDDCAPAEGALRLLRCVAQDRRAMVGGTCLLPGSEQVIYGGLRRRGFGFDLVPYRPGATEACDAVSGNLVCMPAALVRDIGMPDAARLPHAIGDIDFGLRAGRAGWPVLVAHDATARAVPNVWQNHASWLLSDISVRDIWRSAWSKRSYGHFPTLWFFFSRHWGWRGSLYALWLLAKRVPVSLLRLTVPQALLRRIWGNRSVAWQDEQRVRAALQKVPLPAAGGNPAANSPSGPEESRD